MVASTIAPVIGSFPIGFATSFDAGADPFPAPVSPLTQSVISIAFESGYRDAARALRLSGSGVKVSFPNDYLVTDVPLVALDDEAEKRVRAELPVLAQRWEKEYLPRLGANLERLATMNLATVHPRALPFLIDEVVAIARDCWAIRFMVGITSSVAMRRFAELYAELTGGAQQGADALLAGLPGELDKARIGRSDLAQAAQAAGLAELIRSEQAQTVEASLRDAPIGKYFLAALRDHLKEYGLRQDRLELALPTWLEDPMPAMAEIRGFLDGDNDPRAEQQRALIAGVKALNRTRALLEGQPQAIRDRFEFLVSVARTARFIQQELAFYVDQQSMALTRTLFLRLGARLATGGALGRPDDIFMLDLDELKRVASQTLEEEQIGAIRMLVLEREARLECSERLGPPAFTGRDARTAPSEIRIVSSPTIAG